MSKYGPLGAFLRRWKVRNKEAAVELTFDEIERIIAAILPEAAVDAEWWERKNGSGPAPQRRAGQCAGSSAELVSGHERVRFALTGANAHPAVVNQMKVGE